MTEKYDYAGALQDIDAFDMLIGAGYSNFDEIMGEKTAKAIRRALNLAPLAEKVTGEPSEGIREAGRFALDRGIVNVATVFKAMIAQAQKELEPPQAGEEG